MRRMKPECPDLPTPSLGVRHKSRYLLDFSCFSDTTEVDDCGTGRNSLFFQAILPVLFSHLLCPLKILPTFQLPTLAGNGAEFSMA